MLQSDEDRIALIHGSNRLMYTLNLKRPVVCSIASSVLLRGSLAVLR